VELADLHPETFPEVRFLIKILMRRIALSAALMIVSILVVTVLLVGSGEGKTVSVGKADAEYSNIQEAIDACESGDTIIVQEGSYFENILIDKTLSLKGEGAKVTKIDATGSGNVVTITADKVSLSGFWITGGGIPGFAGIHITSRYNHIFDNNVTANPFGIVIIRENYNEIVNNSCFMNFGKGILLHESAYNHIENNTCVSNEDGIYLFHSFHNTISNNTCNTNEMGIELYHSDFNRLENNICNWNVYYGIHPLSSNFNTIINTICHKNKKFGILLGDPTTNMLSGNDRDQDTVVDELDDFQEDEAACTDTDGDGSPDGWNEGWEGGASRTELVLDAFPKDPAASVDTDDDGYPDIWNEGVSKADSLTGLELDEFSTDPDEWRDTDGDGYGDNGDDFPNFQYLHSYVHFFGSILLITILAGAIVLKRNKVLKDTCEQLLTECKQEQEKIIEKHIQYKSEGIQTAEELIANGDYFSARDKLGVEKRKLTKILNDHQLSSDLISVVEEGGAWAEEHGFEYDDSPVMEAKEEHERGNYSVSIWLSRDVHKEIKKMKETMENVERKISKVEGELKIAARSVDTSDGENLFLTAKEAFDARDLTKATAILQECLDSLNELRSSAKPSLTVKLLEIMETGEWNWAKAVISNSGSAHSRNIKMSIVEDTAALKHEKIQELPAGAHKEIELAIKISEGYGNKVTISTSCTDSSLDRTFESLSEEVLKLDAGVKAAPVPPDKIEEPDISHAPTTTNDTAEESPSPNPLHPSENPTQNVG